MSLEGWQPRLTRIIAQEVRRHRDRRKMSAQQLADRTAELGMPIPRPVLANLESGRRESVTVAEILVLAAALDVAPMELICPVGYDELIEFLPGREVDPLTTSRWIDGEVALDVAGSETVFRAHRAGEEPGTWLAEQHMAYLQQLEVREAEIGRYATAYDAAAQGIVMLEAAAADALGHDKDPETATALQAEADKSRRTRDAAAAELRYRANAVETYREVVGQSLRFIRAEMRRRGMLLPPLPPSLKDAVDEPDGAE